jgi:hypothetical protein
MNLTRSRPDGSSSTSRPQPANRLPGPRSPSHLSAPAPRAYPYVPPAPQVRAIPADISLSREPHLEEVSHVSIHPGHPRGDEHSGHGLRGCRAVALGLTPLCRSHTRRCPARESGALCCLRGFGWRRDFGASTRLRRRQASRPPLFLEVNLRKLRVEPRQYTRTGSCRPSPSARRLPKHLTWSSGCVFQVISHSTRRGPTGSLLQVTVEVPRAYTRLR